MDDQTKSENVSVKSNIKKSDIEFSNPFIICIKLGQDYSSSWVNLYRTIFNNNAKAIKYLGNQVE